MPNVDTAVVVYLGIALLVLGWNLTYAGRIARLRRAPRPLAALSALCGLLVAPAVVVYLASGTVLGGHAVAAVAWLWPVAALLFVAQAAYATLRRLVTPLVGIPLLAYDLLLLGIAVTNWMLRWRGQAPAPMLALAAAQTTLFGAVLGRAALATPFIVQIPLIVPAYPARWRATRAGRALLAVAAALVTAVTLLELPRGYGIVRSYQAYAGDRLSERPSGDFLIGAKLLPTLDGLPTAAAVRDATPLADTLDVDVVSLTLRPRALTLLALDSLSKLLEPIRRDSTILVVSLGFDDGDRAALRESRDRFLARRLAAVERVARGLRPEILLPADAPYGADRAVVGTQPVELWRDYLTAAAARARAVNRRIRIGVAAGRYDDADSALYAWAVSRASPIDLVGFVIAPSFNGGAGVDARLRAADRWMRVAEASASAPRRMKGHWVFDVRGFPMTHGDASQERTIWHTLAWATSHPQVVGVIAAEPDDYLTTSGLRSATGRFRPVVGSLNRAVRGLREAVTQ